MVSPKSARVVFAGLLACTLTAVAPTVGLAQEQEADNQAVTEALDTQASEAVEQDEALVAETNVAEDATVEATAAEAATSVEAAADVTAAAEAIDTQAAADEAELNAASRTQLSATITLDSPNTNSPESYVDVSEYSILSEGAYVLTPKADTSTVLDVDDGSIGWFADAELDEADNSYNQRWYVRKAGDETYTVQNVASGLYLGETDDELWQFTNNEDSYWTIKYNVSTNPGYIFTNVKSGKSITVSGGSVATATAAMSTQQTWNVAWTTIFDEGWFAFSPGTNSELRLTVDSASRSSGATMNVTYSNDTASQSWHALYEGDGYYKIFNGGSHLALSVENSSTADTASVVQSKYTGSNDQLWKVEMGNYGLTLTNKNGKLLDVSGNTGDAYSNVIQYAQDYTAGEGWGIVQVEAVTNSLWSMIETFCERMLYYAYDDSHGYDQEYRWGEYGDYDCSSLVITCLGEAGFATGEATYTGNMRSELTARGFELVYTWDTSDLQAGDILLNDGTHTAGIVDSETEVAAHSNEFNGAVGGTPGDQTGNEISTRSLSLYGTYINTWWDVVLRPTEYCLNYATI